MRSTRLAANAEPFEASQTSVHFQIDDNTGEDTVLPGA
jgi:hypothetical protein